MYSAVFQKTPLDAETAGSKERQYVFTSEYLPCRQMHFSSLRKQNR